MRFGTFAVAGPSFSDIFIPFAEKVVSAGKQARSKGFFKFSDLSFSVLSDTLSTSAALVLNHLIAQQPSTSERLSKEAGKVVLFDVSPIKVALRVTHEGYFQTSRQSKTVMAPVDTEIRIDWADLVGSVSSPSGIGKRAHISGDMDFAQAVSATFFDLHWDPENDLARIVGDAQAVWIMNSLNHLGVSLKDLLSRLKSNLREYAVFEKEIIPSADEFNKFKQGVSALRDDLARLEKRMQKMEAS